MNMKSLGINRAGLIATLALPVLLSACTGPQTLRVAQNPKPLTSYRNVCFFPDGKQLAAGAIKVGWIKESCSVFVFDMDSGREVQRSTPPREWGTCRLLDITYHPSRGVLLACYRPKTKQVLVWPVAEKEPLLKLASADPVKSRMRFLPGGRQFCLAGRGTNDGVWDLDSGVRRLGMELEDASALGFSEDGRWVAIGTSERGASRKGSHLSVYDTDSGQRAWTAEVDSPVRVAAVSSLNNVVLAVATQQQAWNLTNGVLIREIKPDSPPTGEKVFLTIIGGLSLIAGGAGLGNPWESYAPEAVAVSPDGKQWMMTGPDPEGGMAGTGCRASLVTVVDIASAAAIKAYTPTHSGPDCAIAMSPDQRFIAIAGNGIFVVERSTGKLWISSSGK